MNPPATPPKPRRRRRWLKRIGIAILIILFLVVAAFGIEWKWTRVAGQRKLDAITARLDAEDPGWRIDDIVAAHNAKVPPDAENSAYKMVEIVRSFPKTPDELHDPRSLSSKVDADRSLNQQARDAEWNALENEYPAYEKGIDALRQWKATTPHGRLRLNYTGGNPISIRLDGTQKLRDALFVLQWDALRAARRNDSRRAIADAVAGLHLVRSFDLFPCLITNLVRNGSAGSALRSLEQTLAWCSNADDDSLATAQDLAWKEREAPMRTALRGERAQIVKVHELMDAGKLEIGAPETTKEKWEFFAFQQKHIPNNIAFCLEEFERMFQWLDVPLEQYSRVADYKLPKWTRETTIGHLLMASLEKVGTSHARYRTKCLCTAAGIACERYRLKHNRWPASLDDLAGFGIPKGLIDPFDGQPLRFKPTENGIVVYSVGTDGIDNDGEVVTRSGMPRDVGFRLWDVTSRRVSQPPPPVEEEIEKD